MPCLGICNPERLNWEALNELYKWQNEEGDANTVSTHCMNALLFFVPIYHNEEKKVPDYKPPRDLHRRPHLGVI